MIGDPLPTKRLYVTLDGQRWELVPAHKLTWPETREVKRVTASAGTPGMSLGELTAGIKSMDPDAWFAWIYVSIRRKWPTLSVEELEAAIGDTPVSAVLETVEEEAPEVADPDPPARAASSDAREQPNGNGSGGKTLLPSTHESSGPLT